MEDNLNSSSKTFVSINYGDDAERYEMCMGMNPVYVSSTDSDTDSDSKEDDQSESKQYDNLSIYQQIDQQDWSRVIKRVNQNNDLAKKPMPGSPSDDNCNLLLHYVCKKNAPTDVIACVMKANEKAVSTPGVDGFLPLHYACAAGASIATIEVLVDAYPGAVKVREMKRSRLPLHLAARGDGKATAEVIALLMSYFPEATMTGDINGLRPLDYAANTAKKNKKTRWEIISVLEMGQKWIRVGQNVTQRLEQDFAERLRALEKELGGYVESLKAVHDEEIARIANDMLDVELANEIMVENEGIDVVFEAKFDELVQKHDLFLSVQEESRTQRLELIEHEYAFNEQDIESLTQNEPTDTRTEQRIKDIISAAKKRETELLRRIAALEKSERLKAGVIKHIIVMSKEKEEKSQSHIVELVTVIDEQRDQIESLMKKIDTCEEQVKLLKNSLKACTMATGQKKSVTFTV